MPKVRLVFKEDSIQTVFSINITTLRTDLIQIYESKSWDVLHASGNLKQQRKSYCGIVGNDADSIEKIRIFYLTKKPLQNGKKVKILQSVTKYYGNFKKVFENFPSPPYTMLQTHNIAWRNFCS